MRRLPADHPSDMEVASRAGGAEGVAALLADAQSALQALALDGCGQRAADCRALPLVSGVVQEVRGERAEQLRTNQAGRRRAYLLHVPLRRHLRRPRLCMRAAL